MAALAPQPSFFSRLPGDIPPLCLTYCDDQDIARFSAVSKNERAVADQVWPLDEHITAANLFRKAANAHTFQKPERKSVELNVGVHNSGLQPDLRYTSSQIRSGSKVRATDRLVTKTFCQGVGINVSWDFLMPVDLFGNYGFQPGVGIWTVSANVLTVHRKIKDNEVPFLEMAETLESRAAPVERRLKETQAKASS